MIGGPGVLPVADSDGPDGVGVVQINNPVPHDDVLVQKRPALQSGGRSPLGIRCRVGGHAVNSPESRSGLSLRDDDSLTGWIAPVKRPGERVFIAFGPRGQRLDFGVNRLGNPARHLPPSDTMFRRRLANLLDKATGRLRTPGPCMAQRDFRLALDGQRATSTQTS